MAPTILDERTVDTISEQVDDVMTAAEEAAAFRQFTPSGQPVGDLSDGGMVNGAKLRPMQNGKTLQKGRPVARRAWMWNGTESLLALAYNPEGTRHDGARHYMLKRQCMCCMQGGFTGPKCPNCAKTSCTRCNGGTVQGKVIPLFYLRKEDVPYPARFYGSIDCFLPFCTRRGDRGFKTEEEMRIHARSRHRMEYQAFMETQNSHKADEVDRLRQQVETLMAERRQPLVEPAAAVTVAPVSAGVEVDSKPLFGGKKRKWTAAQRKSASDAAKARAAAVQKGVQSKSV